MTVPSKLTLEDSLTTRMWAIEQRLNQNPGRKQSTLEETRSRVQAMIVEAGPEMAEKAIASNEADMAKRYSGFAPASPDNASKLTLEDSLTTRMWAIEQRLNQNPGRKQSTLEETRSRVQAMIVEAGPEMAEKAIASNEADMAKRYSGFAPATPSSEAKPARLAVNADVLAAAAATAPAVSTPVTVASNSAAPATPQTAKPAQHEP